MPGSKSALVLAATLAIGACTVAPPTGPSVLALPPEGKDLARFRDEDGSCRQYASAQVGHGSPTQAATRGAIGGAAHATSADLQQRYDVAYAQCMAASGNRLQPLPAVGYYGSYSHGPYAYPAYYGGYYGPWFGPTVSLGFFGRFGPRFHHPGFFHGFHGGGFRRR